MYMDILLSISTDILLTAINKDNNYYRGGFTQPMFWGGKILRGINFVVLIVNGVCIYET